jgi:uncharacterized protein YbaR (Trm112 family)
MGDVCIDLLCCPLDSQLATDTSYQLPGTLRCQHTASPVKHRSLSLQQEQGKTRTQFALEQLREQEH